jgi:hypothetical protein
VDVDETPLATACLWLVEEGNELATHPDLLTPIDGIVEDPQVAVVALRRQGSSKRYKHVRQSRTSTHVCWKERLKCSRQRRQRRQPQLTCPRQCEPPAGRSCASAHTRRVGRFFNSKG